MCTFNATVIGSLLGQFADIQSSPEKDGTGAECDAFSMGITFNAVAGQVAGIASVSRTPLTPCAGAEPPPTDRCCPSQWLSGKTRADTCDTPEKMIKAARFDALPSTVQIPLREPDLL